MSRAITGTGKRRSPAASTSRVVERGHSGRMTASERVASDERLVIRKGDKAVGVVISMAELRYFEDLEDRLDVRDADKALADPTRIPYAEVRKKLGL